MAKRFSTLGRYPSTRLRRNRQSDWSRRLVAEQGDLPLEPSLSKAGDCLCASLAGTDHHNGFGHACVDHQAESAIKPPITEIEHGAGYYEY